MTRKADETGAGKLLKQEPEILQVLLVLRQPEVVMPDSLHQSMLFHDQINTEAKTKGGRAEIEVWIRGGMIQFNQLLNAHVQPVGTAAESYQTLPHQDLISKAFPPALKLPYPHVYSHSRSH